MSKELNPVKAVASRRESRHVEFKEKFDPTERQDWCEIIKDIVAMANTGGGYILFGVKKDGSASEWNPTPLCALDPAQLTDKIAAYTGEQFSEFEVQEVERAGRAIALMAIRPVHIPLIFTQPGTYDVGGGKQKSAFGKGTVYFRHGAKSEPGNSQDIRQSVQREIEAIRKSWLGNIRKVVTAPRGHEIRVLPPEVIESGVPGATPIRIVDDPHAPAYRRIDPNKTHPFRQKEVVEGVNKALGGGRRITSYDIFCVRRAYNVDASKSEFFDKPMFASPQYSQSFVDWMVAQQGVDPTFFDKARAKMKK